MKGTWLMPVALVVVCASQWGPLDRASRSAVAQPEQARGQAGFVAYVAQLPDGSAQAVIYHPAQDRTEILVTTAPTKPSPFVWILPSDVLPCSPYDAPARDGKETTWVPVRDRYVYLDSVTGKVVSPDAHLGIDIYRRQLIDLVDDRALVLEYETDCEPLNPTAKLHLFRGTDSTELGRMFVEFIGSSLMTICYSLSPDRDHVSWTGPDGSYWCDLRTGRIHTVDSGERGLPFPGWRRHRWLPDSSGFIEAWEKPLGAYRWNLFEADGEQPIASGKGRIGEISPDCVYWTIVNESWTRDEYRTHHDPPRVIRIIPGRQPSPETQIAEGPWAIDGSKVRFFAAGRRSASETIVFRITPEGHDSFVVSGKWHGEPRVLQLEDGGRIGMILRPPSSATRIDQTYSAAHDDELVVFDFDGSEKLRTDATILPDCHTVDGDSVLVVDRTPKDWRITRVNFRTGDVGLLLTCHGSSMDVHRIGASYLAMVGQGKKMPAPWDVYVGKSNERSWRFVAQNVRNIRWGPAR